jgi:septal ring factor EnvC (AmiA/AmiB activator)
MYDYNDGDYGDMLQKKYLFIISKYEKILEESSNMNKTIEENTKLIEELNNDLKKLKEEKKKKQKDIVNYLANKESLKNFIRIN